MATKKASLSVEQVAEFDVNATLNNGVIIRIHNSRQPAEHPAGQQKSSDAAFTRLPHMRMRVIADLLGRRDRTN